MIKFKVSDKTTYGNLSNISITACTTTAIFPFIVDIAGVEEAIEATSWAELAGINEVYEHEKFTLKVIEE